MASVHSPKLGLYGKKNLGGAVVIFFLKPSIHTSDVKKLWFGQKKLGEHR